MPRPKKEQPNHAGGLYEVKITIGKTLEGKLLRKSFYSPSSKEDARRQAEQYKIEQEAARLVGEPFITKDITFEDWTAQWLAKYKKDTVRAYTYQRTYDSTIRNHILPKLGKAPLSAIRPVDIQGLYNALAKNYSQSLLDKVRLCLNSIFETAVDNDLLIKNPAKRIPLPPVKSKTDKLVYTQAQADTVFEFAKASPNGLSVIILLIMGLRRGELLGLKWGDIDLDSKTLTVSRSVSLQDNQAVIGLPKTASSIRTLPMPNKLVDELAKRRGSESEFLFLGKVGVEKPTDWDVKIYKPFMADIVEAHPDIPVLNPHELRHTCGTLLYQKTGNIYAVSKFLGHSDLATTTKIYVHNNVDTLRKDLSF